MAYKPDEYDENETNEDLRLGERDKWADGGISDLFYLCFDNYNAQAIERIDPRVNDSWWNCWVGERGTGKSTMSIVQAHAIDPDITTESLCFDIPDVIDCLKKLNRTAILWEEGGVGAYSRDFMTKKNKNINKVLQVFRFKNIVMISNFQSLDLFDNHARRQINKLFWTKSRIYRNENNEPYTRKYLSPSYVHSDPYHDPWILPDKIKLRNDPNYQVVKNVPVPSERVLFKRYGVKKSFLKDYEKLKQEFFDRIGQIEEEEENEENENKISKKTLQKKTSQADACLKVMKELTRTGSNYIDKTTGKKMSVTMLSKITGYKRSTISGWLNGSEEADTQPIFD